MADVFVSYKSEDRKRVARLVAELEATGLSVWWDLRIEGGADWRQRLQEELDAARVVLVMWSRHSVGHEGVFVQDEAGQALHAGKYMPVCIDAVVPPLGFRSYQSIDLSGWKGGSEDPRLLQLTAAIRAMLEGRAPEADSVPAAGTTRRKALIWSGIALAGTAAAFGVRRLAAPEVRQSRTSIAVLPFADMSPTGDSRWIADGVAEELRTGLARIPGLRVISRVSSEKFREPVDLRAIVEALDVSHVLTGSVRSDNGRFRFSAELTKADDGSQLWSQTFDEAKTDSLEVQRRVAAAVLQTLNIALGPQARALLERGGTRDAVAQEFYLKMLAIRGTERESLEERLLQIDAALARDPDFAIAHASRGTTLFSLSQIVPESDGRRLREEAQQAYARANALEPGLALIQQGRANMQEFDLHPRQALEAHSLAMQLPGSEDSRIPSNMSRFLWIIGHWAEAERMADRAIAVDPVNPRVFIRKAMALSGQRLWGPALKSLDVADSLAPPLDDSIRTRAWIVFSTGRRDEAFALLQGMRDKIGRSFEEERMWALLGDGGRADQSARDGLEAGAPQVQFARAWREIVARKPDAALDLLEASYRARENYLLTLPQYPEFAPVWRHPRLIGLVKMIDFPRPASSQREGFYGPKGPLV